MRPSSIVEYSCVAPTALQYPTLPGYITIIFTGKNGVEMADKKMNK
jgi:hypothetical protein